MIINGDKRRAVAARMREIMRQYPNCLLDGMIAQSILDVIGDGVPIGETVASLIDRPTCQMVECTVDHGYRSWGMRCTACGKEFEHVKPGFWWRYCPNCGAEVIND